MQKIYLYLGWFLMGCLFTGCHKKSEIVDSKPRVEEPSIAHFEKLTSKVSVRRRHELVWADGQVKMPLFLFDTIKTFSQSTAQILINDNSEVNLDEDSWLVLDPSNLQILPHRFLLRAGKSSSKTSKELWVLTTGALFHLKAKNESEPASLEVEVKEGKQVRATLASGIGFYFISKLPGQIEVEKANKMETGKTVVVDSFNVEESFPKTENDIRWPSSEELIQSEKDKPEPKIKPKPVREKKLRLEILSPPDFFQLAANSVEILGRINYSDAVVLVNGSRVKLDKAFRFKSKVKLEPGANSIVIRANRETQSETISRTIIRK